MGEYMTEKYIYLCEDSTEGIFSAVDMRTMKSG